MKEKHFYKKNHYLYKSLNLTLSSLKTIILVLPLLLSSCDSGTVDVSDRSSPPPIVPPPPVPNTGFFIDSAVENIAYRTETLSGFTGENGDFKYLDNESITFAIGGVELPTTQPKSVVTPMDIIGVDNIENTQVLNIARLLLSLDEDRVFDNGIQINDMAHDAAQGESFTFDSPTFEDDVVNLIANSGSVETDLVDASTALQHLEKTFSSVPTANAGENVILEPSTDPLSYQLDGSGSQVTGGGTLTYSWTITSQPTCVGINCMASLDDATLQKPTLENMRTTGSYEVSLTVNNGFLESKNYARVIIMIEDPTDLLPEADAGNNQNIKVTLTPASVTLDGSNSRDPEGNMLTYNWRIVSQPACSTDKCAYFNDANAVEPQLENIQNHGDYVVGLSVNDGKFISLNNAQVSIIARSIQLEASGAITDATGVLNQLLRGGNPNNPLPNFNANFIFNDNLLSGVVFLGPFCFTTDAVGPARTSMVCPATSAVVPILPKNATDYDPEPRPEGTPYEQDGTTFDNFSGVLNLVAYSPTFRINITIKVTFNDDGSGVINADAGPVLGTATGELNW